MSPLYRVECAGESDYVEANSFGEAIRAWCQFVASGEEGIVDEEPDSVSLLTTSPIIRLKEE